LLKFTQTLAETNKEWSGSAVKHSTKEITRTLSLSTLQLQRSKFSVTKRSLLGEFAMQRRVVGYARVNADDKHSLNLQISQLEDAGVTQVLSDIGSGMSKERAGLNRLLDLIEADQVKEVVVTRIDRLSRSLIQLQQLFNVCQGKEVAIKMLNRDVLLF
jgi:predicted site-specific integrase-resolvase